MKRASYFKNGMIVGVLTLSACHSLREDAMGQARTLELVRLTWLEWYWSVPLALGFLLVAALVTWGSVAAAAKDEPDGR